MEHLSFYLPLLLATSTTPKTTEPIFVLETYMFIGNKSYMGEGVAYTLCNHETYDMAMLRQLHSHIQSHPRSEDGYLNLHLNIFSARSVTLNLF